MTPSVGLGRLGGFWVLWPSRAVPVARCDKWAQIPVRQKKSRKKFIWLKDPEMETSGILFPSR